MNSDSIANFVYGLKLLKHAVRQLQYSQTACGTLRKQLTKPFSQPDAPDSNYPLELPKTSLVLSHVINSVNGDLIWSSCSEKKVSLITDSSCIKKLLKRGVMQVKLHPFASYLHPMHPINLRFLIASRYCSKIRHGSKFRPLLRALHYNIHSLACMACKRRTGLIIRSEKNFCWHVLTWNYELHCSIILEHNS